MFSIHLKLEDSVRKNKARRIDHAGRGQRKSATGNNVCCSKRSVKCKRLSTRDIKHRSICKGGRSEVDGSARRDRHLVREGFWVVQVPIEIIPGDRIAFFVNCRTDNNIALDAYYAVRER